MIKVYYPILLCSSTGHLHPSKITSSTSIAQTITRQDSNNLLHFENNFLPHITQSFQDFAASIYVIEEKMRRKVLSNTRTIVFPDVFCCFFSFAILERQTDAGAYQRFLVSNLNLQNMRNKMPLCCSDRDRALSNNSEGV